MIRGRNAKSGHNITNHSDRLDEKGCIPERKTDQSKVFRSEKRHSIARLRQKVMRPCPALVHFVCLTSEDQMAILWCAYLTWKESRLRNYFAFTFDWISDRLTFRVTDSRSLLVARDEAEGRRGGQRLARGVNPSLPRTIRTSQLILQLWWTIGARMTLRASCHITIWEVFENRDTDTVTLIASPSNVGVYVDETSLTRRPNDSWVRLV